MSRRSKRVGKGRAPLPVAPSGVPAQGFGGAFTLVPAHYHLTPQSLDDELLRIATVLDEDGREVRVLARQGELTLGARRFLGRVGLPAPEREYAPASVPEEAWAAYERLVPQEWMPSASDPDVFAVRGAMPEVIVATLRAFDDEAGAREARVPLVPRVATVPRPGRRQPLFRLALRDVVRVETVDEMLRKFEEDGSVEEDCK